MRASTTDDPLQTPAKFVKGVGPRRAELLERMGIQTVGDLLFTLPRDVLDLSHVTPGPELRADELQTVRGKLVDFDGRELSGNRTLSAVLLDCDGEYVRGVWFNQPWALGQFREGGTFLFSGKPKRRGGRWEIAHPQVQRIEDDDESTTGSVLPLYSLTEGLKMHEMRRIARAAVDKFAAAVPEHLPPAFRARHDLPTLCQALVGLHAPTTIEDYHQGRRRLIFDDLAEFQFGLALRRRAWQHTEQAPVLETTAKIDARIRRLFPFAFTAGQNQAVRDISADLARGSAMHRLLQADVGAGKTAIAIYAMLVAVAAGQQAVLMAPTEVLALQHWATIDQILSHSRVKRLLLTGRLTKAQRKRALAEIESGEVELVVGTQAVIQADVTFQRLGVAVIDEQHKFGVAQRAHFSSGANGTSPHVLVMTATPIPRSLCMTQYGDLDLTVMTDLPPGRQRVVTSRISGQSARDRVWQFVRDQLRTGRQAYIVCPRIERGDGATPDASHGAEEVFERLSQHELGDFRVGLVHGQMDAERKTAAMESFRNGDTHALVSTTVIEVGVDVPNATLLVVMDAERFGLSQLHQLRGRISRGRFQGYCFLFSETASEDALSRLNTLEQTSDGFAIAEADFVMRGPGDVLGTRQHGELPLKVADLTRDSELLSETREAAFALVASGEFDEPQFAPLKIRVLERFGRIMDLPKSG
jgi:ATP-dependent DNA helicase RecG